MIEVESVIREEVDTRWHKKESKTVNHILLYVADGRLTYYLNGQSIHLQKGDVLYIPKGTMRLGVSDPACAHQKYAVFFQVETEQTSIPLLDSKQQALIHISGYEYVRQRFATLIQQWLGTLPHYQTICKGILIELLGIMDREAATMGLSLKKRSLVAKIQAYILEHYQEQIQIEELARLVDRTPNYVTRIFREVAGQTPVDYLHRIRVQAANDLMLNSHLTIGQIAEKLGYCDQSYFNRVYKKITGYPPSDHLPMTLQANRRKSNRFTMIE